MASAITSLTVGWSKRSRGNMYSPVKAFRVAQGHTMPFLGRRRLHETEDNVV
jgi:hypothetical protein